jgi:hypothetical protein
MARLSAVEAALATNQLLEVGVVGDAFYAFGCHGKRSLGFVIVVLRSRGYCVVA